MSSFKDESFILQYLSPKVIRDLKLFSIMDDDQKDDLLVPAIHDENGYRTIRETLAAQYNLGNREPNVQIWSIDRRGDRSLTLRHQQHDRKPWATPPTKYSSTCTVCGASISIWRPCKATRS
jgi:stage V sporulation protein R